MKDTFIVSYIKQVQIKTAKIYNVLFTGGFKAHNTSTFEHLYKILSSPKYSRTKYLYAEIKSFGEYMYSSIVPKFRNLQDLPR